MNKQITELEQPVADQAGRIVMYRNEEKISEFTQGVEEYVELVNDVLTSFKAFNLGSLTMEDVRQLVKGTVTIKGIVQDRLVDGKAAKVGGLNLNLTQLKEIIELPDLSEVEADVARMKYKADWDKKIGGYHRKPGLNDVSITDGVAAISDTVLTAFVDSHTCYATTDDQKEVYLKLTKIKDQLQEMADKHGFAAVAQGGVLSAHGTGPYGTSPYEITLDGQKLSRQFSGYAG